MRKQTLQIVSTVLHFPANTPDAAAAKCNCIWNENNNIGIDALGGEWQYQVTDDFGGIFWVKYVFVYA